MNEENKEIRNLGNMKKQQREGGARNEGNNDKR